MKNYSKRYLEQIMKEPLPQLKEDERIYLNVPTSKNSFAKATKCGFDLDLKLWFTGIHNYHIVHLVKRYGVNEATSEKAVASLKERMEEEETAVATANGSRTAISLDCVTEKKMKKQTELQEILAQSEEDVNEGRVASMEDTFNGLRAMLKE